MRIKFSCSLTIERTPKEAPAEEASGDTYLDLNGSLVEGRYQPTYIGFRPEEEL